MTHKHKHYEMIRKWIEDTSRKVDCRSRPGGVWTALDSHPLWDESMEYRFADSVLRYRVALFNDGGAGRWTAIANNAQDEADLCHNVYFREWLTDWTEVTEPVVEKPEPKIKRYERWLNLYPDGTCQVHRAKETADERADSDRVECRRIEWGVEP